MKDKVFLFGFGMLTVLAIDATQTQSMASSSDVNTLLRQRSAQGGESFSYSKESRQTRIANCLREMRNTADQMALACERRHPVDKQGNTPGRSDCYDQVTDYLTIETASCRKIK